jgi:hypothetical protein
MYRKNVNGQVLCVQLLLTATGAVATGLTPTARKCIDGTFSAGGGTFTEDGSSGSYKYVMVAADTNGNNISVIVTATGAIPVCINFVTTAADPTDSVRFGLTALPNAAASAIGGLPVAVDTSGRVDVLKINGTSQTARDIGASVLLSAGVGTGQLDFTSGVVKANATQWLGGTIPAVNVTGVPLVDLKYTLGTISPATAGSVRADSVTGAVGSLTTNNDKTGYALTSGERTSIADSLLDRDMSVGTDSGSPSVRTVRQALRFLRNKWSIASTTLTVTKEDDTTASWTSTLVGTAGADPITSSDPA